MISRTTREQRAQETPEQRAARVAERTRAAVDARHREDRAVALRLAGWSFQRIADELGWSGRQTAQAAYERAVARIPERNAKQAKAEAVTRCQHMISVWLPRAADGEVDADRRLLAWEERLARLQGTDAPTRVIVPRSPVDEAIEALAAELAGMSGEPSTTDAS